MIEMGLQGGSGRGLTSSEVMNDEAAMTRVCLRGHVNTVPFVIERSIKRYPQDVINTQLMHDYNTSVSPQYLCGCLCAWYHL